MLVHPLVRSFIRELERLGKSKNTLKGYQQDLQKFLDHLNYELPETVNELRGAIEWHARTLQEEGKAIPSVNRFLSAARGFSRFLKDRDLITHGEVRVEYEKQESPLPIIPDKFSLYEVHVAIEELIRNARTPESRWLHARNHFILQLIEEFGLKPHQIVRLRQLNFQGDFFYPGDGRKLRLSVRIQGFLEFYLKETKSLYGKLPDYLFFGTGRSSHFPLSTKTVERVLGRYGESKLTTDGIRSMKILGMEVNEKNAKNFGYKSHYTLKYRKERLMKLKK